MSRYQMRDSSLLGANVPGASSPLTEFALPDLPPCIILSRTMTTVICDVCGDACQPGHMPTNDYGFRCGDCCEVHSTRKVVISILAFVDDEVTA